MALVVQKYGGTSVGTTEKIRHVAERVASCRAEGNQVVVVVSAMSGVTNRLIKMAAEVSDAPSDREMDMLLATGEQTTIALTAMALHSLDVPAISLTGAQAGIVTDGVHSKARIANITPTRIHELLDAGNVVIVAGFQGQTMQGQITTLGRGGSDLSAIALAAVIDADLCQICTDVDGVYTADPRVVKDARKIPEISYEEMLEMASLGSKVMQSRAVEFASKFSVIFEVKSTFNDNQGTIVKEETASMENVVVRGVSVEKNQAKVTIAGVPDKPGEAAKLFSNIARANVNVDMIVQNVSVENNQTDITFTFNKADMSVLKEIAGAFSNEIGARDLVIEEGVAKLSVVGIGMRSHSGVAAGLFTALADKGINIQMISTSEIKISVVVDEASADEAAKATHERFSLQLEKPIEV
ncbi:MAG: aspartate kinase [Verrucomicrobiota bacterium]